MQQQKLKEQYLTKKQDRSLFDLHCSVSEIGTQHVMAKYIFCASNKMKQNNTKDT